MEKSEKEKEKHIHPMTIVAAILILAGIYLIIVGSLIYFLPSTGKMNRNNVIRKTVRYIPYPAAIVGSRIITMEKLSSELQGVKNFYERQDYSKLGLRVDFSTQEGEKRLRIKEKEILSKLIEGSIIEAEAHKRNIVITDEMVDQAVDRKMKEYGTGNFLAENLEKLYGWKMDDFKIYIVKPDLYKEGLMSDLARNDPSLVEGEKKITEAKNALEGGESFSEVAKKYSDGESSAKGGDLGWFKSSQMIPEVALQVFEMKENQVSDIILSSIGYHIVKLEEKKMEGEEELVKVHQVFVRTKSFPEWLLEAGKSYRVIIPIRDLKWNHESGTAEFRPEEMKKYQEELENSPINDPSVIF